MQPDIIKDLERRLVNLGGKCINGEEHQLNPFIYYGETSDFEYICKRCGGYMVEKEGIYSNNGLLIYLESERYLALVKTSEMLKNDMGKGKNL